MTKPPPAWGPPSLDYLSPAHILDFPSLDRGHPAISKTVVQISDIEVNVHGLEEATGSGGVVIMFLTHGFANKASQFGPMAAGIWHEVKRLKPDSKRDLILVALDQPNHGNRRRFKTSGGFNDNPMRLVGFSSGIQGGLKDQQYLLDTLPAFLWPSDERKVEEWVACGMSMGGHQTWRLLRDDPRVRIGIPITAVCPERLMALMDRQMAFTPGPPSYYPESVRQWYETVVPASQYAGKKILALHGALDQIIPPELNQPRMDEIKAACPPGEVEFWVQEGRGHVISPEMVAKAAAWVARWAM